MFNCVSFFLSIDTSTTAFYTLSLHDALPIYRPKWDGRNVRQHQELVKMACKMLHHGHNLQLRETVHAQVPARLRGARIDRKSTRLNSSHPSISYAVFCLKKKTYASHHNLPLL